MLLPGDLILSKYCQREGHRIKRGKGTVYSETARHCYFIKRIKWHKTTIFINRNHNENMNEIYIVIWSTNDSREAIRSVSHWDLNIAPCCKSFIIKQGSTGVKGGPTDSDLCAGSSGCESALLQAVQQRSCKEMTHWSEGFHSSCDTVV